MKKLIAMLLILALVVMAAGCAGKDTKPTEHETQPSQTASTEATVEVTVPQQTEPTQQETLPQQTEPTEAAQSGMVTVYLLERTSIFDSGYQVYTYDEDYNIVSADMYSLEDTLMYKMHFTKQDENGMFCECMEEFDGESQYYKLTWFADGKLQEVQYDPGFSGDQYEYDAAGRVSQMRNYYNGILDYTVYFEYDGDDLQKVYCENAVGIKLFDCKIENSRIVGKNHYDADGTMYYSYEYRYDAGGNLEQELFIMDGEISPSETHSYMAVEVDAARAYYLIAQQQYLLDITHNG